MNDYTRRQPGHNEPKHARSWGQSQQEVRLNATDPDRDVPGPEMKTQAGLFVIFRRVLVRLEYFRVVGENYVAALSSYRPLHILISIEHSRRGIH